MHSEINNSRDDIKRRMLKQAMNYYDIKNGNEQDLDPIVKLMMEALSLELYNLGNDIVDTQVRVLEKIANLLTPDFLTCPNPAHAILHSLPIEPTEKLNDKTIFFTQKKMSSRNDDVLDTSINVFFTPVDNVRVFDAQVSYAVTGNKVFKYDTALAKQPLPVKGEIADVNTVWLGVKTNKAIEDINNLYFYFDWKNLEPQQAFRTYQLLQLSKWYVNDQEIKTKPGFPYIESNKKEDIADSVFAGYNLLSLIKKDVKSFYEAKFITIDDAVLTNLNDVKQNFPPVFRDYFRESDLLKWNEKLLWVKIVFPAGIQQELIDELSVCLNAFPVINRKLNEKIHRLNKSSNIIPLETSDIEQFLSVQTISDESREYKLVPYSKAENEKVGTYALRNGGVERFDSRNAKEIISYLIESLRNESIAFSAFGLDNISTPLKEIGQRIALIELKTTGVVNNAIEIPHYIIVKPFEGKDLMYVEYWSTLAEVANGLRAGTRLQQFSGTKVKPDSLILLTTTAGGKSRLKPEERLNAFKYGMMSRNRIITKEDIRSFFYYELGSNINGLSIDKGFEMSADPGQGFNRTIDITLQPSKKAQQSKEEWQVLCEQLKLKLQTRSGMSNNYRVLLKSVSNN